MDAEHDHAQYDHGQDGADDPGQCPRSDQGDKQHGDRQQAKGGHHGHEKDTAGDGHGAAPWVPCRQACPDRRRLRRVALSSSRPTGEWDREFASVI